MSTSGSTNFSVSRNDIINRALGLLGVIPQGGTVSDYTDAVLALNLMVKAWMACWQIAPAAPGHP
jgi:hypothetical protein